VLSLHVLHVDVALREKVSMRAFIYLILSSLFLFNFIYIYIYTTRHFVWYLFAGVITFKGDYVLFYIPLTRVI